MRAALESEEDKSFLEYLTKQDVITAEEGDLRRCYFQDCLQGHASHDGGVREGQGANRKEEKNN